MAKKTTGTAVVKWDEKFAGLADKATKGMKLPGAKFISLSSGRITIGGAAVKDNELRVIVIGATHEHTYYDPSIPYDSENPESPLCYAFGEDEDEMSPHEDSPEQQNDACRTCPLNEFGSAERGKGKACANKMRLAVISEDSAADLDNAEVLYLKVPVTSTRNWIRYAANDLAKVLKRPYWSVLTKISVEPDAKTQFRVDFELEEKIEDSELFEPLEALWVKTMGEIDFPYVKREAVAKAAPKPKKDLKKAKFAARR